MFIYDIGHVLRYFDFKFTSWDSKVFVCSLKFINEPIEFSILVKLHMGPEIVLGYFIFKITYCNNQSKFNKVPKVVESKNKKTLLENFGD